ncbi:MAG: helix-turn-helix transcriptional regulator [Deltaproteobacteria bacterium]|nr:helix-turn-helix transcriptional regulator [Deltaproteobacteria bacterium]
MKRRVARGDPPASLVAYELEPGRVLFVHALDVPSVEGLSAAEQEVLALVLDGHDTRAIAEARGTASRTTSNQVASIFKKLGVRSRAELAAKLMGSAPKR